MISWRIYERDVDLLLAEEFSVNRQFATWLLKQSKSFSGVDATVVEVHVSLVDAKGESDLVLIFIEENKAICFAILIENKIDAVFQPSQLERYRERGEEGVKEGRWSEFDVILCAPRTYIERSEIANEFDARVTYEDMSEILEMQKNDDRTKYRAAFLKAAAPRGASAYVPIKDDATDEFWKRAYKLACEEYPELEMREPDFAKDVSWVTFRPADFPVGVCIYLKGDRGIVDLTISNIKLREIERSVRPIIYSGMSLHQTGKSSAVRLRIIPLEVPRIGEDFEAQIRSAFDACIALVQFYRNHCDMFERLCAGEDLDRFSIKDNDVEWFKVVKE